MSDPEIGALRAKLAARPRSDDYRQRRRDIDARGLAYGLPADVGVEPATAGGVKAEWTATPKRIKQISLAADLNRSQRSVSQYLRGDREAGTLDLDDAEIALRHIGSNLAAFIADQPPPQLTVSEQLARDVLARPDLLEMVRALSLLRRRELGIVRRALSQILPTLTPPFSGSGTESPDERPRANRTKVERGRRRERRAY